MGILRVRFEPVRGDNAAPVRPAGRRWTGDPPGNGNIVAQFQASHNNNDPWTVEAGRSETTCEHCLHLSDRYPAIGLLSRTPFPPAAASQTVPGNTHIPSTIRHDGTVPGGQPHRRLWTGSVPSLPRPAAEKSRCSGLEIQGDQCGTGRRHHRRRTAPSGLAAATKDRCADPGPGRQRTV